MTPTTFDPSTIRSASEREHYIRTQSRYEHAMERVREIENRADNATDEEQRSFTRYELEARDAADVLKRIERTADLRDPSTDGAGAPELRSAALGGERRHAANSLQVSEPLTYTEHTRQDVSFFRDIRSALRDGDQRANDRLNRHREEMRSLSVGSATAGGNLTIPTYLNQLTAEFVRSRAPLYGMLPRTPIQSVTQFKIPKITTGTEVGQQASEGATLTSQDPVVNQITVDPITVGAYNPVSQQLLDSAVPFIDQVIYRDLAAAMAGKKENYIINGSGSSQPRGLLNLSSAGSVTIAAATPAALYAATGEAVSDVATSDHNATHVLLHTGLWAWWQSRTDADGRPVLGGYNPQNAQGAVTAEASDGQSAGSMYGCNVVTSNRMPTNLGGSTNQTRMSVFDASRLMVFDSAPVLAMSTSDGDDFQNLMVAFRIHSYFGFVATHDAAVSNASGAGLTYPPTF